MNRPLLLLALLLATNAGCAARAAAPPGGGALQWAETARADIEAAHLRGDLDGLHAARAVTERALSAFPDDPLLLHYQGYALYREASLLMAREREQARALLEAAEESLVRSSRRRPLPESHALLASIYGQLSGLDPRRAAELGPRVAEVQATGGRLGPRNPRVWLLRGSGAVYTPEQYGGGLARAEEWLQQALALYPTDAPAPGHPGWGHAEANAWLGIVYERQGRTDLARAAFLRALELEPGYAWVRRQLLPSLERAERRDE
jgi:tetratricopeptide (TPR) repeat protein